MRLVLTGPATGDTYTDVNGNFRFDGVYNDTWTLTPSLSGWTFNPASRIVTVAGGNIFGQDFTGTPNVTTSTLTVASSNPNSGVFITVSPNDNNGQGNGTTQFTRTYNNNTGVTLTAPSTAGGNSFQKWQRNGVDLTTTTTTTVTMDANYTMTAVYVTPPSPTTGTIQINAMLNGAAWSGAVSYRLTGPQTIDGTSVPQSFTNRPTGSYTLSYISGGPSWATLSGQPVKYRLEGKVLKQGIEITSTNPARLDIVT